jgi:hypothetical protein
MSNPSYAAVPAQFQTAAVSFIAVDTTTAKVLVEPMAAVAAGATSPLLSGGCTVIDMTASSTDAAAKDVTVLLGQVLTTVGTNTGAVTTTTSTIVRTVGDYIADGWKPGEVVMMFNNPANQRQTIDGVLGVITAVAALTLTVNGTPLFVATPTSGVRICRMSPLFRTPVPANSGSNGTVPNVALLGASMDSSGLRTERKLGATDLLAVSLSAAVSALPAYISVNAQVARY